MNILNLHTQFLIPPNSVRFNTSLFRYVSNKYALFGLYMSLFFIYKLFFCYTKIHFHWIIDVFKLRQTHHGTLLDRLTWPFTTHAQCRNQFVGKSQKVVMKFVKKVHVAESRPIIFPIIATYNFKSITII